MSDRFGEEVMNLQAFNALVWIVIAIVWMYVGDAPAWIMVGAGIAFFVTLVVLVKSHD